MPNRPILCGKCGTSSDEVKPLVMIETHGYEGGGVIDTKAPIHQRVQVSCEHRGCGHSVSSDSLPAALAKFEEKPK